MKRYLVWTTTTKPKNGKFIVAKSSLDARQICAAAWMMPIEKIMARAEIAED